MKKTTKRSEVYKALDSERDYQEKMWDNCNKDYCNPSSFLLWMDHYMSLAKAKASTVDEKVGTKGSEEIMDIIRKITALGVACGEFNGMPKRKK